MEVETLQGFLENYVHRQGNPKAWLNLKPIEWTNCRKIPHKKGRGICTPLQKGVPHCLYSDVAGMQILLELRL